MWQEIMMDVSDVDGDRFAGVRTLPVRFLDIFLSFFDVFFGIALQLLAFLHYISEFWFSVS